MTVDQRPLDGIYRLVRNALTEITEGLHSAQSTDLAINAVLTTVYRAVADFAETWNDTVPSRIFSLPNELRVACLSQLPFRDRVTASHTSRRWRQLLLANAILWNSVSSRRWPPAFAAMFEAVLSRTHSAPLDMERIFLDPIPFPVQSDEKSVAVSKLRVLLDIAMPRIRFLNIIVSARLSNGDNSSFLWNTPAPMLESLTVHHSGSVQIPESWWQRFVPRLRSLRLDVFQLPSTPDRTNRLEVFDGTIHHSDHKGEYFSDAQLLFVHFPHLVSLTLRKVSAASMLPNTLPPHCLQHISLWGTYPPGATGDFASILRLWRALPLRTLAVHDFNGFTLDDALEFFWSSPSHPAGPWKMRTSSRPGIITMQALDDTGLELQISPLLGSTPTTLHDSSYFCSLHSLRLEDLWVITFLRAGISLPTLASLSISDSVRAHCVLDRALEDATLLPLRVPALRLLIFIHIEEAWTDTEDFTILRLPDFIRSKLRYDTAPLRRITVTADTDLNIDAHVRPLCSLASEVCYEVAGGMGWTYNDTDRDLERFEVAHTDSDDASFQFLVPLGA